MSFQLPSPANFRAPDKNEFHGWLPGFVDALNKFMQQTVTALSAIQAPKVAYKVLTVLTTYDGSVPTVPITFDNPLPARPRDVHLAQIIPPINGNTTGIGWRLLSTGQVQVMSIHGLEPNTTYELHVSVS